MAASNRAPSIHVIAHQFARLILSAWLEPSWWQDWQFIYFLL
jgi:hypothetical protein